METEENRRPGEKGESEESDVVLKRLANDLRLFIELSMQDGEDAWSRWVPLVVPEPRIRCWEKKNCKKADCPVLTGEEKRCWLVVGTMCCGKIEGEFALKYRNCTECDVYRDTVYASPIAEVYEHLVTLVHSLRAAQHRLRAMATRDLLTGLFNRNYFNETIALEIEKAKRYGNTVSIIMVDIDDFKRINDRYGHLHGDGILRECAAILKNAVRSSDLICRFGGDEFLIFAPEIACGDTDHIAGRIEGLIEKWNAGNASGDYRLTLSIGCSVWTPELSLADSIHEADRLMYENKAKKKNASDKDDRFSDARSRT